MAVPRNIMETTIESIIAKIQAEIPAALAAVRADRLPDQQVNLTPFLEYFRWPKAIGLRSPVCFVLGRNIDFHKDRGGNFINCTIFIQVSAVIDERTGDTLTKVAWRYHDALHSVLDRAELVSDSGRVKNVVKVVSSDFADVVDRKSQIEGPPFRTEVMLLLEVEHYETEK